MSEGKNRDAIKMLSYLRKIIQMTFFLDVATYEINSLYKKNIF